MVGPCAAADLGDDAGATDLGAHVLDADLSQRVGHQLGRAHLLEAQFRVLMDVTAQSNQISSLSAIALSSMFVSSGDLSCRRDGCLAGASVMACSCVPSLNA